MKLLAANGEAQAKLLAHVLDLNKDEWHVINIGGPLLGHKFTRAVLFIGMPYATREHGLMTLAQFEEWLDHVRTKMDPQHLNDVYIITGG